MPLLADRHRLQEIVDPRLEGQYSNKDLTQLAAIAAMCVQGQADYRPLMRDVVQSLLPLVMNSLRSSSGGASGGSAGDRRKNNEEVGWWIVVFWVLELECLAVLKTWAATALLEQPARLRRTESRLDSVLGK